MKKSGKTLQLIIRILATLAVIGYILFLIDEGINIGELNAENITVALLALFFLVNYIILWKNEFLAGILLIVWFAVQWVLVLWVWSDGEMTLIFGFPIFIIGILALIYEIRYKAPVSSDA